MRFVCDWSCDVVRTGFVRVLCCCLCVVVLLMLLCVFVCCAYELLCDVACMFFGGGSLCVCLCVLLPFE